MARLAMNLDMASEMKAPPKPNRAQNASRPPRFRPLAVSQRFRPSTWAVTDSSRTTAKLVARNSTMRFIESSPMPGQGRRV
jgi:hypothetical protein